MTGKRKIVIKVKYPVSENAIGNLTPKMITEWNVKRILLVGGALVMVLVSLFYVINSDARKTDLDNIAMPLNAIEKQVAPQVEVKEAETTNSELSTQKIANTGSSIKSGNNPIRQNKQTAAISIKRITQKQPAEKVSKEREYSKVNRGVSRALLTYGLNNKESVGKESVGEIVRKLSIRRKNTAWVYYFTELKSMNGSKVYHEWLKNGVVVSRLALSISGDTWSTSSRKLLSDSAKGKWAVRLVDKAGRLLNEKKFEVE